MATKLYFRSTSNAISGLPTTEQSSLTVTSGKNADALTVNRTLDTVKGSAQAATPTITTNNVTSQQILYFSRFVSDTLNMTSIPAQTWTYNFAAFSSSTNTNFPVPGTNGPVWVCCYIWRPSGSVIATILDGDSASVYDKPSSNAERVCHGTFSGASVSFAAGDVLIFEVWCKISQATTNARTLNWYYDGTTENTTENALVTNHASFLDSPQTLTFGAAPIDMTVTGGAVTHPKPIQIV